VSGKPVFQPLQKLEVSYDILSLCWLNNRCLAVVDTAEVFHLHDVKHQEELESADLSGVQLVYGSSFFKGLATGGNVSKAMALAAERAVYGSIVPFTDQLLILGERLRQVEGVYRMPSSAVTSSPVRPYYAVFPMLQTSHR